ncbi:uncharacterized protein LOC111463127 [Cucurbita moschata]|uniref:Uncharacterized protein LOC111463127 n=1 Tax=Cucurbita moschata TaxID=3662 RepID=A0A6J1HE04_CUCMO|nr:uncharacterized protein LOC111463127 [Cucurbita moschata]
MMPHKPLHELLQQDQEPFHLNTYIADKRVDLKRVSPKTDLQLKKRKPISSNSVFRGDFCRNGCFKSFHPSPELRKSPLFEFRSPARNRSSPNAIFLHVPARTAALLLEAALKIHKQKSTAKSKKTQIKNQGLARFGSVLKRLTLRNRNNTDRETEGCDNGGDLASFGHRKSAIRRKITQGETSSYNGRSSYGFWSETNEEGRSMDLGTSCSSQSVDSGEDFCESPFRFVLQRSSSYGCQTPDFLSPAASPCRRNKEDETVNSEESLKKFQVEEDEEDKEQCSPVSVLDGPFDDTYDERRDNRDRDGDRDEDYNLECSYATVQRTKQQLLNKLQRFQRLANLDPIELEKIIQEEEEEEEEEKLENYKESVQWDNAYDIERFVKEVGNNASSEPRDMRKLVMDLIAEEEAKRSGLDAREEVIERVCRRLEEWEVVELKTIEMMVEEDLRKEVGEWKKEEEEERRGGAAMDLELAIFSVLVEELAVELAC